MPTTRAQEKAAASDVGGSSSSKPTAASGKKKTPKSKTDVKAESKSANKGDAPPPKKRQRKEDEPRAEKTKEQPSKKKEQKPAETPSNPKIDKLIQAHGDLPLESYGLPDPLKPTPENMLANLFNAMLTSARIAHGLATKSVRLLLSHNYHDLGALQASTWDERTAVLTEGGYTHYREKTATQLGELADFLSDRYGGDLNAMLDDDDKKKTKQSVRKSLSEIKGIGTVGIDVFFDSAQAYWPFLAPFLDRRSIASVRKMGLVSSAADAADDDDDDVVQKKLWKAVGEDPVRMARLANAVSFVRLEGREKEFS